MLRGVAMIGAMRRDWSGLLALWARQPYPHEPSLSVIFFEQKVNHRRIVSVVPRQNGQEPALSAGGPVLQHASARFSRCQRADGQWIPFGGYI